MPAQKFAVRRGKPGDLVTRGETVLLFTCRQDRIKLELVLWHEDGALVGLVGSMDDCILQQCDLHNPAGEWHAGHGWSFSLWHNRAIAIRARRCV